MPSVSVNMAQLAADAPLDRSTRVWNNENGMRIDVNFCLKPELKLLLLICVSAPSDILILKMQQVFQCSWRPQVLAGSGKSPLFSVCWTHFDKTLGSGVVIQGNMPSRVLWGLPIPSQLKWRSHQHSGSRGTLLSCNKFFLTSENALRMRMEGLNWPPSLMCVQCHQSKERGRWLCKADSLLCCASETSSLWFLDSSRDFK